jgi:glutamine amidotransferase
LISIVDYGLGNVLAFATVYKKLNIPVSIAKTADDLSRARRIILPGVGAFDHAMELLEGSGMRGELDRKVKDEKVPVLGICVGMQIIAGSSEEGRLPGLGWIEGEVKRFDESRLTQKTRLPHMGWNDVNPRRGGGLFRDLEREARFYFLHSFYFSCRHETDALATSDYGGEFASAVGSSNVYGVQFHPEKSHHFGTQLLKNFAEM